MIVFGWVGSFLLAICALPQAWMSYKQGNSNGVSHGLLWLWASGEVVTLVYVGDKMDLPLIMNYATNIVLISIVIWYKYRPRT